VVGVLLLVDARDAQEVGALLGADDELLPVDLHRQGDPGARTLDERRQVAGERVDVGGLIEPVVDYAELIAAKPPRRAATGIPM